MPSEGTVLVVESEDAERARIGEALEQRGYHVIACPGPTAPGYMCIGSGQGYCSLVVRADVIVLDTWLPGDDVGMGTTADELLALYTDRGRPVVLIGSGGSVGPGVAGYVVTVPERPAEADVVAAVRSAPHPRASCCAPDRGCGLLDRSRGGRVTSQIRGRLGPSCDLELREDRRHVVLHRLLGELELVADLLVGATVGDQRQDPLLLG